MVNVVSSVEWDLPICRIWCVRSGFQVARQFLRLYTANFVLRVEASRHHLGFMSLVSGHLWFQTLMVVCSVLMYLPSVLLAWFQMSSSIIWTLLLIQSAVMPVIGPDSIFHPLWPKILILEFVTSCYLWYKC